MGSGLDEWMYWLFFKIIVNYNSSHIELLLNDICLMNPYEESMTPVWISRIHKWTPFYNCERTK
jgi:hypothetical protein